MVDKTTAHTLLSRLFYASLVCRFLLPFYLDPLRVLRNDWGRHWNNGIHLLDPSFLGSFDPKLYQLWIYIVSRLTGNDPFWVAALTGLLCASMPWLWYRACRECFSRSRAMAIGLTISVTPSLFIIYGYFMTETLLLNMMGLSFWMTLRARRKQTLFAFSLAAFCWGLTTLSRLVALPMAGASMAWLLYHQRAQWKDTLAVMALIAALLYLPASWHTYQRLYIFYPFQIQAPNEIYRKSGMTRFFLHAPRFNAWFASPSYLENPLRPLGDYRTPRLRGKYHIHIDTKYGWRDWQRGLDKVNAAYGTGAFLRDLKENIIYLLFGPPWPEAKSVTPAPLRQIALHTRWMWPPLLLFAAFAAPFIRTRRENLYFLAVTWMMVWLHVFQQSGVMDGRFRKPIEPLLLVTLFIALEAWRTRNRNGAESLFDLARQFYRRLCLCKE